MVPMAKGRVGKEATAKDIKVYGIVQGVGFRPYVYKLSQKYQLKGWVLNNSQGVTIHWEGQEEKISQALMELLSSPPPLAKITGYDSSPVAFQGYSGFFIQKSCIQDDKRVLISPDVGICSDCLAELQDPSDRRFSYPFINCTNCGPRFTIIRDIPYDRHLTTMKGFTMCPQCRQEYDDPSNRRFHAQPNACPACGPKIEVRDSRGKSCNKDFQELFKEGAIVAIKGLGGFHLACNALDGNAVSQLRKRKFRDAKPFALMAYNLETVRKYCHLSAEEEDYLVSPARPIIILKQREETRGELPPEINPHLDTLGVMLPYTPLHWLLFSPEIPLLVMTSANLSGDPLITKNEEAAEKLKGIADYFIFHNREIENPCDDSVGMVVGNTWQPVRRARGYVPLPVQLQRRELTPLLACGGNLKNTFALAKGDRVFLSQHLGDLDNYLNFEIYKKTISKMISLLGIKPELIVHDLHPGYQTTRYARELASQWGLPAIGVQHHHSHMVSCMAENGLAERVMAVICDGTGYGTDGTIWGFEFLCGDYSSFKRMGHLAKVPLPGGEASIKRPLRMAYSFLLSTLGETGRVYASKWLSGLSPCEVEVLEVQLKKGINSVATSSCGRLFDAAAALMGICREAKYEGQGPMVMEASARMAGHAEGFYTILLKDNEDLTFELDTAPLWEELISDLSSGLDNVRMAYKFHMGVARAIRDGVLHMSRSTGLNKVVISGGVFQNRLLTELVMELLAEEGIAVYRHKEIPPNDGGISLGQAVAGNEVMKNVRGSTA